MKKIRSSFFARVRRKVKKYALNEPKKDLHESRMIKKTRDGQIRQVGKICHLENARNQRSQIFLAIDQNCKAQHRTDYSNEKNSQSTTRRIKWCENTVHFPSARSGASRRFFEWIPFRSLSQRINTITLDRFLSRAWILF